MTAGIEQLCKDLVNTWLNPSSWKYQKIAANGYNPDTIDGIGSLYASDGSWARNVKKHMQNIFGSTTIIGGSEAPSGTAQAVVNLALEQVGKPYVWGASGPNKFDCSGLVMWAYKNAAGIDLPHNSASIATALKNNRRALSNLKVGDILYRTGHCAIYIGNGQCVEAKGAKWGVVVSEVSKKGFTAAYYVFE